MSAICFASSEQEDSEVVSLEEEDGIDDEKIKNIEVEDEVSNCRVDEFLEEHAKSHGSLSRDNYYFKG